MLDITKRIAVIRALVETGSQATLTYAALECRLTIEQVCYERLKMSYGHISYDDLRKWQPRDVVRQVVEDANEFAASGFTVSISKTPLKRKSGDITREEFEAFEYVQLGEQVGFNLNKLSSLWNALSNVALHAKLPVNKDDDLQVYGPSEDMNRKVEEAIVELEKLKSGTLLASAIGANYCFSCSTCGTEIRRIEKLLKHGQIVNCVSPSCNETYLVHKEGGEAVHSRRIANVVCDSCGRELCVPLKLIDKLRFGDSLPFECESCDQVNNILLVPVQHKKAKGGESGG